MAYDTITEQAEALTSLLPDLMRRLFALDLDDPTTELPVAQLRVCTILEGGAQTMSGLSRELNISLSAITQIADRLERAGMVERVVGSDDRRMRSLRLTAQGIRIMDVRRDKRVGHVLETLSQLTPESREAVLRAVGILLDASPEPENEAREDVVAPVIRGILPRTEPLTQGSDIV